MIAAYITGTVTGVVVLAPSVLAVAGASATSTGANIAISTFILVVMLVIAVRGIKLTARTQVGMAVIEYAILIGFAVAGLAWVFGRHPGTVPVTQGWFTLSGVSGKGDLAAGLLATSLQSAFNDVVNLSGQMFAVFYILTALAAVTYYRRRILSNAWDAILVGLFPLGGAGFLAWILYRYLQTAATPQLWSFASVIGAGLIMMAIARFGLRSGFFQLPRESALREP